MTFWTRAKFGARLTWAVLKAAFAAGFAVGYIRALLKWRIHDGDFRRYGGIGGGGRGGPAGVARCACGHWQPCVLRGQSGPQSCACPGCLAPK